MKNLKYLTYDHVKIKLWRCTDHMSSMDTLNEAAPCLGSVAIDREMYVQNERGNFVVILDRAKT